MKTILLLLLLCSGCSVARYYKAAEISTELKKNASQLAYLEDSVETDYQHKAEFYKSLTSNFPDKSGFVAQELRWRIKDMEEKKNTILAQSSYIRSVNDSLLTEIEDKKQISENDPVFDKIEEFSDSTTGEAKELFEEFDKYRNASAEFSRFVLFSKSTWQKSTKL